MGPLKVLKKYRSVLFESLMVKQWTEKKKNCLDLVTPIVIQLWLKSGAQLNSEDMKPHIIAALKHRGKETRFSVCDFIAQCTVFSSKKQQIRELFKNKEICELLGNAAINDNETNVRIAGCMAMHGLNVMGAMKKSKANRHPKLIPVWEQLQNNKRSKKNLAEAIKNYEKIKRETVMKFTQNQE